MKIIDHIPDESAWFGYESDFDVRDLHERFFGEGSSISRFRQGRCSNIIKQSRR